LTGTNTLAYFVPTSATAKKVLFHRRQIDSRQSEVRVRFAGLPNGDDSDGSGSNNYARLYFSRRKKNGVHNNNNNSNSLQQQQQQQQHSQVMNNKKNKSQYEMPFVVNRFYFHDQVPML
jgi:hypothetical protein